MELVDKEEVKRLKMIEKEYNELKNGKKSECKQKLEASLEKFEDFCLDNWERERIDSIKIMEKLKESITSDLDSALQHLSAVRLMRASNINDEFEKLTKEEQEHIDYECDYDTTAIADYCIRDINEFKSTLINRTS